MQDTDNFITSLERLVAKKRAIKQGMMQELLTGRTRLPGFDEPWQQRTLGELATLQRGFDLPSRVRRSGRFPIVSSSGIADWHDQAKVAAPGVVTGRYGTIGSVFYIGEEFWPLNTTLWVSSFHSNDPRFVYYFLQRVDFDTHSGKSGVPGVNRNDLHRELVSLPNSIAEQQAIASVLHDTDAEIDALERRLEATRAIKTGMMQELLTGRTRLPVMEGVS